MKFHIYTILLAFLTVGSFINWMEKDCGGLINVVPWATLTYLCHREYSK